MCVSGADLASGAWGVALTHAELGRRANVLQLADTARELASVQVTPRGAGLFSGREGQRVAAFAATAQRSLTYGVHPAATGGDLMDGVPGQRWAAICLGSQRVDGFPVGEQSSYHGPPGLAHGFLGALASDPCSVAGHDLPQTIRMHSETGQAGWCNGVAGTAVAAIMAWKAQRDARLAEMARESAHSSLSALPLRTDGLCHGSLGVLVVAAGVARCLGDEALLRHAVERRDGLFPSDHSGWQFDGETFIDQSWLTGTAGIAWGLLVIDAPPSINPLCPPDALTPTGGT